LIKGTQLNPSAAMWVEVSRAEFSLGEFNDAVQHATQAVELDANAPTEAHLILANSYLKLKRYGDAERQLRTFLKRDPDSPSAPKAREILDKLHRAGVRAPNE
jgi:tetratricopeptide (TPR) repeat protein